MFEPVLTFVLVHVLFGLYSLGSHHALEDLALSTRQLLLGVEGLARLRKNESKRRTKSTIQQSCVLCVCVFL